MKGAGLRDLRNHQHQQEINLIDHVYHFHTVDEIRSMFKNCGLIIDTENILPVEDAPMAEIINQKITINYSAIVKRNS